MSINSYTSMSNIKFFVFDCMETLVDIKGFIEPKDYAYHTFKDSGAENYWLSFDHFYQEYLHIRSILVEQLPENKEYDFLTMFKYICEANDEIESNKVNQLADQLFNNFWRNYTTRCYIDSNVDEILSHIKKKYGLGIVSNFKVVGGIETLLKSYNINQYFDFVITSASFGWRKPDQLIYKAVFDETNLLPEQHLFIGDDYENDFRQPIRMGMKALFLDRNDEYPNMNNRIKALSDLPDHL